MVSYLVSSRVGNTNVRGEFARQGVRARATYILRASSLSIYPSYTVELTLRFSFQACVICNTHLWHLCALNRLPCTVQDTISGDLLATAHHRIKEVQLRDDWRLRRWKSAVSVLWQPRCRAGDAPASPGDCEAGREADAHRTDHGCRREGTLLGACPRMRGNRSSARYRAAYWPGLECAVCGAG